MFSPAGGATLLGLSLTWLEEVEHVKGPLKLLHFDKIKVVSLVLGVTTCWNVELNEAFNCIFMIWPDVCVCFPASWASSQSRNYTLAVRCITGNITRASKMCPNVHELIKITS